MTASVTFYLFMGWMGELELIMKQQWLKLPSPIITINYCPR